MKFPGTIWRGYCDGSGIDNLDSPIIVLYYGRIKIEEKVQFLIIEKVIFI